MSQSGDFGLHQRLGRRRNRHVRLTRAAVCLLLAALICWITGMPWTWQIALSLVAASAGLSWPVHGSSIWAMGVIGDQTGLAYETALALEARPRDDFGFRSQVRARARSSIAGLEQPHLSDWWLAALILGMVILLLPALELSPPWASTAPEPPPAVTAPAAADDEEDRPEDEPAAEEPEPQAAADEALPPQAPAQRNAPDELSAQGEGTSGSTESEGAVLDRFLDNLRERPRQQGTDSEVPGTPVPTELENPVDPSEEDSEGTSPSEASDDPSAQESEGEAGSDGAGSEERSQEEEDGSEGGPGEEGQASEQAVPGDESGAPEAGADDSGEQSDESLSQGEGNGDGAGGGPGIEVVESEADRPGLAGGPEELLQGQISGNEVNLGGDIRLPGFSDVELPPDASPATLGEAVERSLTEGTVPLEYQEVIRNYFR